MRNTYFTRKNILISLVLSSSLCSTIQAAPAELNLPPQAIAHQVKAFKLNPSLFNKGEIELTLPSGEKIIAERMSSIHEKNTKTWNGKVKNEGNSNVAITLHKGSLTGSILYQDKSYEISSSKGQQHFIFEIDRTKFPEKEQDGIAVTADVISSSTTSTVTSSGDLNNLAMIDVLFLYTPAAVTKWGLATVESKIKAAVNYANTTYKNSEINITLRLAGMKQVDYVAPSFETAASDLVAGSVPNAHTYRNQTGADMVSLMITNTESCGYAWVPSTPVDSHMFSVFNGDCVNNQSVTHELGHNMGAHHNVENAPDGLPYEYGQQHCFSGGFRTVMSYTCAGINVPRVPYFSNPNVIYNSLVTGTSTRDNARKLNTNALAVANLRKNLVCYSNLTTAPPSNLTTSVSLNDVTLQWTSTATSEEYTLIERSLDGVNWNQIAQVAGNITSFSDLDLNDGTTYHYRAKTRNCKGDSSYTAVSTVVTKVPNPTIKFSQTALNMVEGTSTTLKTISVGVTLSAPHTESLTASFSTQDSTATVAGSDYQAKSGTVTFPAGSVVQYINLNIAQDAVYESNETFYLKLVPQSGFGTALSLPITIQNDDVSVSVKGNGNSNGKGNNK